MNTPSDFHQPAHDQPANGASVNGNAPDQPTKKEQVTSHKDYAKSAADTSPAQQDPLPNSSQFVDKQQTAEQDAPKYSDDQTTASQTNEQQSPSQSNENEQSDCITTEADNELLQTHKLQEQIVRLQADMENMRRRHQQELSKAHAYGLEKCFRELMPVVDSLAMALQSGQAEPTSTSLFQGVEMTAQMLEKALAQFGMTSIIPTVGESFNPERHEAMTATPTKAFAANCVMQVIQSGFMLNDRLLRPARVIVSVAIKQ